jgi:glycosyltransferase involved in cell wall biosynthesis
MTTSVTQPDTDRSALSARLPVAIISNSHTPYRLALHLRIAREIPQIKMFSLYTHGSSNAKWKFSVPPEINPVQFGEGEDCGDADKAGNIIREWKRGGQITRWLKENDIRFVVLMGYNDPGRLRIIRWCRRRHIPCFLFGDSNICGDRASGWRALLKRLVVSRIVRSCAGILVCGSLGRAYFLKYGAQAERIFYFPYEPDYRLIETLPQEKVTEIKRRFGLADDRRRLVYSGRLVGLKRVDLLFQAFVAIARQRPQWDLVVVGDGPDRAKLAAMIPPELVDRVLWAGFVDDQAVVSAIYRASDVLVLPSDFEPWALVINEAAAAGLAIVSSNVVGAAAELVREDVNGRLFAPGDVQGLIRALLEVTEASVTDRMKAASAGILADWRQRGDPVEGLRHALKCSHET